jgi:hypothetical protein
MIPVVAGDVEGEKLSLYNPAEAGSRFPQNAVRLKNTTGLHLKGGPVTLFDGGAYAGDARMEDIPPGDSRLLTYAVDLAIEGDQQQATDKTSVTLTIRRGVLTVTVRERRETRYTLKSKAARPRQVLIEHPFDPDWTLISPAVPQERAAEWYRFGVRVAPGATETLTVVTEQPRSQTFALLKSDTGILTYYVDNGTAPPEIRSALAEVVRRRARIQEARARADASKSETEAIGREQERIRNNMAALDQNSALYGRYVDELDKQETRIQILREDAQRLRDEAAASEADLRAYLDTLDLGEGD